MIGTTKACVIERSATTGNRTCLMHGLGGLGRLVEECAIGKAERERDEARSELAKVREDLANLMAAYQLAEGLVDRVTVVVDGEPVVWRRQLLSGLSWFHYEPYARCERIDDRWWWYNDNGSGFVPTAYAAVVAATRAMRGQS